MAFVGCLWWGWGKRERLKVVVMYPGTCVFPYCRTDVPTNCKQGSKVLVYFLSVHNSLSLPLVFLSVVYAKLHADDVFLRVPFLSYNSIKQRNLSP